MAELAQKIELFINQAGIAEDSATLGPELTEFFTSPQKYPRLLGDGRGTGGTSPHVLLKRSILYFLRGGSIVSSQSCHQDETDATVYTFDGQRVERMEPDFYLSKTRTKTEGGRRGSGFGFVTIEMSNNNNNGNNNNNNG